MIHPSQAILNIRGNPLISENARVFFFFFQISHFPNGDPPPFFFFLAHSYVWLGIENDHNAAHYTIGLGIVFITSSVHINAESSTDKFGSMSQAENWTKSAKKRH